MAYLMLAEKKPSNKPLLDRMERKLNQMQRQGIRLRDRDARLFSAADDDRPPGGAEFSPPEFETSPEPRPGFPPPRH